MTRAKSPGPPRSETLYSSALYLKKLEVVENAGSRGSHIFSGTRIKSVLIPFLFWLLKHTPLFVALLPLRLIVATMQLLYGWRKNTLRQSCEYICVLSKQAGYNHEPRQIYRKMLNNMLAVVQNYFQLYRDGLEAHLDRVELSPEQSALMNKLVSDHDGLMMAVPHNFGSGFSSFKLHRAFPLVLIGRNPSTIARTSRRAATRSGR